MSAAILTVTQLNYSVRNTLEQQIGSVWLMGEISNLTIPASGHWYLTLKDDRAQVRCAMFRGYNGRVNFRPQNGMSVLVRANVSLYEPRGDYQLIIESMQPAGDGLLQQKFDELKMKLAAEGLFAQERKRPLPQFVKRVGIVTSATGAALQDILHILKRRDPSLEVLIYPTMVQGKEAIMDIATTIDLANARNECDVLIVGRGGGSLEDLWCFNEEVVARAIFRSAIPIISAVGHETDVTIADFVADLRAPTPSAAAEIVSQDRQAMLGNLQYFAERLNLAFDRLWQEKNGKFSQLLHRLQLQHPQRQLQQRQVALAQFNDRIMRAVNYRLKSAKQELHQLAVRAKSQHPQQQLNRQKAQFNQVEQRLTQSVQQLWQKKMLRWENVQHRLARNPLPHQLYRQMQQFDQLHQRINYAVEKKLATDQQKWQQLCTQLDGLSPLKILARGYSVTMLNGEPITDIKPIKVGDKLHTKLHNGEIISQVLKLEQK